MRYTMSNEMHEAMLREWGRGEEGRGKEGRGKGDSSHSAGGIVKSTKTMNSRGVRRHL